MRRQHVEDELGIEGLILKGQVQHVGAQLDHQQRRHDLGALPLHDPPRTRTSAVESTRSK